MSLDNLYIFLTKGSFHFRPVFGEYCSSSGWDCVVSFPHVIAIFKSDLGLFNNYTPDYVDLLLCAYSEMSRNFGIHGEAIMLA